MANIAQVIKYEGDNTTFVWKSPIEDFNTQTQLIVHESQEAVFYMNGQILDVFQAGRHTLETQNIPLISKFYNKPFDNNTPFHCEVYFINKTEQMAVKWGTDSKIEYIEPTYNFPIQIGASGEMSLRVIDSCKLLVKVVGTETNLTQSALIQKFRAFLMMRFKGYLSSYIRNNSINIFQIDEKLPEMSESIHKMLVDDFEEYGLSLVHFFVTTIVKPESDATYRRFKEIHFRQYADIAEARLQQSVSIIEQETEKQKMILEAEGMAQKRQIEGYTYAQERGFDVAQNFAKNEGAGNVANLGIGLGVMAGVGGTVGGLVNESLGNAVKPKNESDNICPNCGNKLPQNAKFCLECGTKIEQLNENEIICPHCNKKTSKGKFCMECGGRLQAVCPNCGKEAPQGAKFCLECGTKLEG
ncbi:MAG: SPFH domain-containing protein [Oscillospiraceae bacterium]|nr:SPFH domain-containing protein [Oscillospiraceae bacterium]